MTKTGFFSKQSESASGIISRQKGRITDSIIGAVWFFTAVFAVFTVLFILVFLLRDGLPVFSEIRPADFLFGEVWNPGGAEPSYGILPLITGTLLVTIGAMVIATPLGIGSAIFISELAGPRLKAFVKPAFEMLAGIPSVVYGFFGLIVLTNQLRIRLDVPSGESWLAGSILLGIMALPTIISVSEDAISAVPREFREGSLALGATRWQTISQVLVPSALSGITAALILGMGRAIGETMAVMMVTGNAAVIPEPIYNVLSPVRTLTGTLGIEMGEVATGSTHYHALFGLAVALLVITLIINLSAMAVIQRLKGEKRSSFRISERYRDYIIKGLYGVVFLLLFLATDIITALAVLLLAAAAIYIRRHLSPGVLQKGAFGLIWASAGMVLLSLAVILYDIIIHGYPALTPEFLTSSPSGLGREGGIFPAIIGTLYLVAGSILFALPIGMGAAIYLREYTRENTATRIIRTGVDLLGGTPSIVFGLFGFAFLVLYLNLGVSMLAGQITLGLMILPIIIRTTEESLKNVPDSMREGSLALGATRWQTVRNVVLPPALPGIITGAILSIGRAAGETAPILFTAVVFSRRFLPDSVFEPVTALPYHLFILSTNVPGSETNQYGTALVLLILVASIYLAAVILRSHFQKKAAW